MDYPFKSDGCSVVIDLDQEKCCVIHDWAYWKGGTAAERRKADRDFRMCVEKTKQAPWLALIRWIGVRIGGVWWIPARKWRWGYGWKWPTHKPPTPYDNSSISENSQRVAYWKRLRKARG